MNDLFNSLPFAVFPVLFLAVFVAMWLAITLLLSHLGGWQVLAKHFQYADGFPETRRKFRRVIVRRSRFLATNYGNVVTIGADSDGFYVKAGRMFKLGHAPLRIPYSEISAEQHSVLKQQYSVLKFPSKTHVEIVMFTRDWHWVRGNAPDDLWP